MYIESANGFATTQRGLELEVSLLGGEVPTAEIVSIQPLQNGWRMSWGQVLIVFADGTTAKGSVTLSSSDDPWYDLGKAGLIPGYDRAIGEQVIAAKRQLAAAKVAYKDAMSALGAVEVGGGSYEDSWYGLEVPGVPGIVFEES